jgi:hypothetical protein
LQIYDDLREIGLLSGGVEPEFDRVTRLSARLLGCETSLFSVIDEPGDRQYFKAAIGLGHPWAERGETPLSHSFCKTVVAEGAVVRVTDARRDPRFRNNWAVDELGVTSYLGVPVQAAPGQVIGALCAISGTACEWSIDDEETLLGLAAGLSRTVELRMALHKQRAMSAEVVSLNKQFNDLAENVPGAIFRYLVRPDGRDEVEYMSPGCQDIWEASAGEIEENIALLWDIIVPLGAIADALAASVARRDALGHTKTPARLRSPAGPRRWQHPLELGDIRRDRRSGGPGETARAGPTACRRPETGNHRASGRRCGA